MTSLEERIVKELHAERDRVPKATPGPMPASPPRWPRYLGAAAALMVVLVGAAVTFNQFLGGEGVPAAAVDSGKLVIDGDVSLPVQPEPGTLVVRGERLSVFAGTPAPPPAFDLDVSGVEQPLITETPVWDQSSWAGNVPLVYIGDRSGRSVFVHTNGTIGLWDRLFALGDIGDHICMTIGDSSSDQGGAGFCSGAASSHGGQLHDNSAGAPVATWWTTWIDVPTGTAVVTLSVGEEPIAWQRPVAETAFFDLAELPTGDVTMTAIGVGGEELATEVVSAGVFR